MELSPAARVRLTWTVKLFYWSFIAFTILVCALAAFAVAAGLFHVERLPASIPLVVLAIYAVRTLRRMRTSSQDVAAPAELPSFAVVSKDRMPLEGKSHTSAGAGVSETPIEMSAATGIATAVAREEASREQAKRLLKRHRLVLLGFGILATAFSEYARYTRTASEYSAALWAGGAMMSCLHVILALRAGVRSVRTLMIAVAVGAFSGPFLGLAAYGVFAATSDAADLLVHSAPAARAALVCVAGLMLYVFRRWTRSVYGLTEATLGVFLGAQKLASASLDSIAARPEVAIAVLTAGVYLVVRGLDNIEQGMTRAPRDAVWTAIRARYVAWAERMSERLQRDLLGRD